MSVKLKNIAFFISSLGVGGAERQLVLNAVAAQKSGIKTSVIIWYGEAVFDNELLEAGVDVYYVRKKLGLIHLPSALFRLVKIIRIIRPQAVYSFMDMNNVLLALVSPFISPKIIWGIRASNIDREQYGFSSVLLEKIELFLSPLADLIICNSDAGKKLCIERGFSPKKTIVIENGIDVDRFKYSAKGAMKIREEFKIADNEKIILLPARLDIMKDHKNFFNAAKILLESYDRSLKFICVGGGDQNYKNELLKYAENLGILENVIFTNARNDIIDFYSSSSSSSSFGEGFSNAIAESMSCGTICAVTDVGDSAKIVG
ncbi:MAG: glycosyltransferase, partial [Helicobacteraceae bacterium]|nr:glycosyltransferase [Helicobacteraceae bacterium]